MRSLAKLVVAIIPAAVLSMHAGLCHAQAWPSKPVRVIVPAPAGTAPDIAARLIGDKLSTGWGQQMIVENRASAGGIIGLVALAKSAPDGYTFGIPPASALTLTPHLFKDPQFDIDRDFSTVAILALSPLMIAVNPALKVNSIEELVRLAKSTPDKINFAPPLINSAPHIAGEMLSAVAGIKLYTIAYNGSIASVTATVTGESQVTMDGLAPLMAQVKAGKLRALAVTSKKRIPGFENLPAVSETFPNFEAIGWFSVMAPANTPAAIMERVNRDVNAAVQLPDVLARFADLGMYPGPGSTKASAEFLASERALWGKVVRDLGIKPQ